MSNNITVTSLNGENNVTISSANGINKIEVTNSKAKYYAELAQGYMQEAQSYAQIASAVMDNEENINIVANNIESVINAYDYTQSAQESAASANESAALAQMYAQQASTGMLWIELKQEDWELDNGKYKRGINSVTAVTGVFKGNWQTKQLIDADIVITTSKTTIYSLEAFDGYVLCSTAVIKDEEEIRGDYYVFEQATSSDTWVIEHNLNKYPSVTLVDSANTQFSAKVKYDSVNQCTIFLNGATTGKAYLN